MMNGTYNYTKFTRERRVDWIIRNVTVSRILRVVYSLLKAVIYMHVILESLRGKITELRCAKPLIYRQEKKTVQPLALVPTVGRFLKKNCHYML
jgi:hypothetical protein